MCIRDSSTTEDLKKSMDTLLEQQQGILFAMNGLGLLIAFAVLFNTLVMNIAERDFELSTLRVLGAPMNKLGIMLLGEHLFIGIVGGIIACFASVLMANLMLESMVQWAFYFTIEPTFYHISVIGGIVVGMAVALTPLGMRRIYKMNLIEKTMTLIQFGHLGVVLHGMKQFLTLIQDTIMLVVLLVVAIFTMVTMEWRCK